MKKDLKRIKVTFRKDVLDNINALEEGEWDTAFPIKVEKLLMIAFAYQPFWDEDNVFEIIKKNDTE